MKVSCSLALPSDFADDSFDEPVTVRLSIQDVTMLDESSMTVAASTTLAGSTSDMKGPFELEAELRPGRQYALYAHLDFSGDGTVASGDLINTTRIPIVADPTHDDVQVEIPIQIVA